MRDDRREDLAIDHRNDGVVVAREHQGLLPEMPEPWQAGPEADRVELLEVTAEGWSLREPRDRAV
jgi:hypothetical protein